MAVANSMPPIRSAVLGVWALFTGLALIMLGNGLQGSLLGIRSALEGFSTATTGIVMAGYFAGFLAGSPLTQRALGRVGHIRVFAALASLASSSVLLHSVFIDPVAWTAMRFVTGFSAAGLYVVIESWLNEQSTNETRGRVLSAYMVVTMGSLALGQLLLNAADTAGFELFVIASVLFSLSLVPITLSTSSAPPVIESGTMSLREIASIVPSGLLTVFVAGFTNGTVMGLAALYGVNVGMDDGEISVFVAAAFVGALALQIPIGTLSDKLPRRGVILGVALAGAAFALVGTIGPETGWWPVLVLGLVGGMIFPNYSLGVAYTNDWLPPDRRTAAAGVTVAVSGVGALAGPVVSAVLMQRLGDGAFWWSIAAADGLLAIYMAVRIVAKDGVPLERQSRFAPIPARATSMVSQLARRRRSVRPNGRNPRG